ncbi:hypothetical protein VIBNISFn135_1130099 [Vibrio nigripulchritudo SFn135]|nr:hypothetical protein VIBNISFn135_1130099 [Vibrio nigripulchritudo SFn135]
MEQDLKVAILPFAVLTLRATELFRGGLSGVLQNEHACLLYFDLVKQ